MNEKTNNTVVFEFETYMIIEKGLSENTIKSYKKDLKIFFEILEDKHYKAVTEEDVLKYMDWMEKKYRRNTILRKISVVKSFYNFLLREDYNLEEIPTANIEDLNKGQYIPSVLTSDEIKRIIEATPNTKTGVRDRVIIKTIFATGARVSEIINLKIEDIDLVDFDYVRILGKGGKGRLVPLYEEVGRELKYYIDNIRKKDEYGINNYKIFDVSRQLFWHNLKKYAKNAGIKKNVHPHLLRHSIATEMIKNGADIRVVQEILGHSSIATTEVYTHLDKSNLKKMYNKIGIGDE
jgi:integrase/recombinase XerD